jgi:hypothetical protein
VKGIGKETHGNTGNFHEVVSAVVDGNEVYGDGFFVLGLQLRHGCAKYNSLNKTDHWKVITSMLLWTLYMIKTR